MNIEHHTSSPSWADRYEIAWYVGEDGDYRCRVRSRQNKKVLMVSSEGYRRKTDLLAIVTGLFPGAQIRSEREEDVTGPL